MLESRTLIVPPRVDDVTEVASRVLREFAYGEDARAHAALCEALINAIVYGSLRLSPSTDDRDPLEMALRIAAAEQAVGEDRAVVIDVARDADDPRDVMVAVRDPGAGFDWRRVLGRTPAADAQSGRGIAIMRAGARGVTWNAQGNQVTLRFRAPAPIAPPPPTPPLASQSTRKRRVLVVDDEKAIRELYRRMIAAAGYEVEVASNAEEALATFLRQPPDVALVDVQMPGVTGIDLVAQLEHMGLLDHTSALLVTASTADDATRSTALRGGAVDFLSKPVGKGELLARIERSIRQIDRVTNLEGERASLNDSVASARAISEALMPPPQIALPRAKVTSLVLPCSSVGGDLVDVFQVSDSAWVALLVDVAGHGVGAALSATAARAMLRDHVSSLANGLPRAVEALNRRLSEDMERTHHHAAVALVRVDVESGVVEALNAGCPPLLFFMRDGALRRVRSGSPPAGLVEDAEYSVESFALDEVSEIVVLSDGITEGFATTADTFGALTALTAAPGGRRARSEPDLSVITANIASLGPARDDASLVWIVLDSGTEAKR